MKLTATNIDEVASRLVTLFGEGSVYVDDTLTRIVSASSEFLHDENGEVEALGLGIHFPTLSLFIEELAEFEITESGVVFNDTLFDGEPFTVEIRKYVA